MYEALAEQLQFRITALTRHGLEKLDRTEQGLAPDCIEDRPLPPDLERWSEQWLFDGNLRLKERRELISRLRLHLGDQGYLLLAATAGYPRIHWGLTRALDSLLCESGESREFRLRKLARLHWFRHAHIPDGVRLAIIKDLNPVERELIKTAYLVLLKDQPGDALKLPIDGSLPQGDRLRAAESEVRQKLELAPEGSNLSDQILASVVRGRKPRALEFAVPLDRLFRRTARDSRWLAVVLTLCPIVIPGSMWLNQWFWETEGRHVVTRVTINNVYKAAQCDTDQAGESCYRITIRHSQATAGLARNLQQELSNRRFNPEAIVLDPEGGRVLSGNESDAAIDSASRNRVLYGNQHSPAVASVLAGLDYVSYGTQREEESTLGLNDDEIIVELTLPPRVYQGALSLKTPVLTQLPEGCFEMGGTDFGDESPRHRVCVPDFWITTREVSFRNYDAFAEATGRPLTEDSDWGRGDRPVINIDWTSATDYSKWLGKQLKMSCSLPTEAEWEYAARAGTTTAYAVPAPAGSDNLEGQNMANCDGCGSEWDDISTAPVGSFPPNAWGLYDMHGNVWEWVKDCWHDNYENAPADGSVWLEANGGDCGARVLRGGSWFYNPVNLRSAGRDWLNPGLRNDNVGFRVVCRPH